MQMCVSMMCWGAMFRMSVRVGIVAAAVLMALSLLHASPTLADSGGAGSNGNGGAGGAGNPSGTGVSGTAGDGTSHGGGGGGSGISGGNGAAGGGGGSAGGTGAVTAGGNGGAGVAGGGGGGGAAGGNVTTSTTNGAALNGGTGGSGANGTSSGGGGGGEGGYGAVINGAVTYTNTSTITGGTGGTGGLGGGVSNPLRGGQGGDGGAGVATGVTGATVSNSGTITGGSGNTGGGSSVNGSGNGGAGGSGIQGSSLIITNSTSGTITGGNGGTPGVATGGAPTGANGAGGAAISGNNLTITNAGTLTAGTSGGGTQANAITLTSGTNFLTLQTGSTINGNIAIQAGTLTFNQTSAQTLSNIITGAGAVIQNGTGALTLSGTSTYTGATTVTSGTLNVTGSIATSSLVTVNGGTLSGTGTVGAVTVASGGTFAPGTANTPASSMTVNGAMTFQTGSTYQVYLNPTTASVANVTGGATLAGTVNATFAGGSYITNTYTILTTTTGVTGTFGGLTTSNLPSGFTAAVANAGNNVTLVLTATLGGTTSTGGGTNMPMNQTNVATSLNNYFNGGGTLPPNFVTIFALSGTTLANALAQLTGEVATGAKVGAMSTTTRFMGMMLEPCSDGRSGSGGGCATPSTRQSSELPSQFLMACADVCDANATGTATEQRWTAWGSPYGGFSTANGSSTTGSNNVSSSAYGFAAGMDYRYSPDIILGFGLSGGGTNWSMANSLGTGNSAAAQIGIYGIGRSGPAYLAGGLSFANHFVNTSRNALGDQLNASFNAQSYGGRVEGGYRFNQLLSDSVSLGIAPYVAVQAQDFHTPAYAETDITGLGYGLAYNASDSFDTRTELGVRFDSPMTVGGTPVILRARAAWAHDFVNNPAITATFQALPGASFTVNGASIPTDSALVSLGAEFFLAPRLSAVAKFDGEFSQSSQSYAGNATLRYTF